MLAWCLQLALTQRTIFTYLLSIDHILRAITDAWMISLIKRRFQQADEIRTPVQKRFRQSYPRSRYKLQRRHLVSRGWPGSEPRKSRVLENVSSLFNFIFNIKIMRGKLLSIAFPRWKCWNRSYWQSWNWGKKRPFFSKSVVRLCPILITIFKA